MEIDNIKFKKINEKVTFFRKNELRPLWFLSKKILIYESYDRLSEILSSNGESIILFLLKIHNKSPIQDDKNSEIVIDQITPSNSNKIFPMIMIGIKIIPFVTDIILDCIPLPNA